MEQSSKGAAEMKTVQVVSIALWMEVHGNIVMNAVIMEIEHVIPADIHIIYFMRII